MCYKESPEHVKKVKLHIVNFIFLSKQNHGLGGWGEALPHMFYNTFGSFFILLDKRKDFYKSNRNTTPLCVHCQSIEIRHFLCNRLTRHINTNSEKGGPGR